LGPFGDLDVVPTGGIRHDEVGPWLEAGALAVGLGSDLVGARPGPEDFDQIAARARVVVRQVEESQA
ncbi:MAG: 2-dehydro-3-deoxyphosphogluconate aldolase, partial [Solirubrobacterales bacterium]|nr:2-dehydro-3-deoxyphosphogluconate aldolase [Solirubrobacterales bacterium]